MGKKFTFTSEGIGSRSYYLTKIRGGADTVNLLKTAIKKSWYDASQPVRILVEEKLIEDVSRSGYPKYKLTTWGEQEAKRFDEYDGPKPTVPVVPDRREQPDTREHHAVPQTPKQPMSAIVTMDELKISLDLPVTHETKPAPIAALPAPVKVLADEPKLQMEDSYLAAYHELLHEQFGDKISFKDVLARMKA